MELTQEEIKFLKDILKSKAWEDYKEFSSTQHDKEDRYFQCLSRGYDLKVNHIYLGSTIIPNTTKNVLYVATDISTPDHTEDWMERTKSDYDKQELLEEAKRIMYDKIIIDTPFINHYIVKHPLQWLDDNNISDSNGTIVYKKSINQYAKIVKEESKKEPLFVFEVFKGEIMNALDKYEKIINQKNG